MCHRSSKLGVRQSKHLLDLHRCSLASRAVEMYWYRRLHETVPLVAASWNAFVGGSRGLVVRGCCEAVEWPGSCSDKMPARWGSKSACALAGWKWRKDRARVAGYGGAIHCLGVVGISSRTVYEVLVRHKICAFNATLGVYSVTTCMFFYSFGNMLDSYWDTG